MDNITLTANINYTQSFMPKDIRGIPDIEIWRQLKEANKNMELKKNITELQKEDLEAGILWFYKRLKEASKQESKEGEEADYWCTEYIKHFNITTERHGRTS